MAPVGQKRLEVCEEKSSKPYGSKMRQLSVEINHSCSRTQRVHFIFVSSRYKVSACFLPSACNSEDQKPNQILCSRFPFLALASFPQYTCHSRLKEQFSESQTVKKNYFCITVSYSIWKVNYACEEGYWKDFHNSKWLCRSKQKHYLNSYIKRQRKILKTISERIFLTFKQIFISWHYPIKYLPVICTYISMSACLRSLALKFTYKNFNYKCTVRRNLNALVSYLILFALFFILTEYMWQK